LKIGVLFDLDGTLLNTLDDLADAVNATLNKYNCPERTTEEVRQFIGNGAERLIRLSLPGKENDPPVAEVLAFYQIYYATHSQIKTRPYDGILDALKQIAEKYPIAIVSNKPDIAVKPLCKDYFGDIYARGESDDCPRKPAPDMVKKAMAEIGVDACVYVGDSDVDVVTAKNAGVPCLSVLWGFRDRNCMIEVGGKHFCNTPAEMPQILTNLIEEYYGQ
jgi:phosphoglycolate phosphatase